MKLRLATLAIAAVCAMPLAGCVAAQIPSHADPKGPIEVPESLKPTDVAEPMTSVDAACASSWPAYEEALDTYDADFAKIPGADVSLIENFDPNDPVVQNFFAEWSELKIARGEAIRDAAEGINNSVIEDLLIGIGEGGIADGEFTARMTDAALTDDELTAHEDKLAETEGFVYSYAEKCSVVVQGSTGA